ncbi:protein DPCD-like [Dendronephthya gigantea]|uniref:protein DPCD-like n=1 Tax=Dendronephthya gigantea TaxID=151771 RepID=UPI00106B8E83|nr:protein DPCD-like [Dendronephthya gigantea]
MATKTKETAWLQILKNARKTSLVQDGRRKIHYTFPDSRELVEEYDIHSSLLLVRKWKSKTTLGVEKKWEFEVGEDLSMPGLHETSQIVENRSNPIFVRKDTRECFQWRIRNLPYSIDVYDVTINDDRRHIIIRTKNKKYYKKYDIPDLVRNHMPLDQKAISIAHANNTLIIKYKKPAEIMEQERLIMKELESNKASREGDIECAPS